MKTILITGAGGFIGSHLTDRFINEGYFVLGVDDFSTGSKENLRQATESGKLELIDADITADSRRKFRPKRFKKIEAVVHLAAKKIPRYGNRLATLETNTAGTKSMLELARELKTKFVLASTSDVYGMNKQLPFSEQSNSVLGTSNVGRWAYAVSKLFDEHLAFGYQEEYKIPITILRYFGSYGPRHHRSWWGGPQSVFIDAALNNERLPIHGDGKQTRSFCYITDTIEATFRAVTNPDTVGQIINIGNSEEISMIEMARLVLSLVGETKSKIRLVPYQSFTGKEYQDVRRRVPDITKAERLLNWQPRIDLRDGLRRTIKWHRQHPISL